MEDIVERIHNFSAGPGVLPEEVLLEIQADLLSYKGKGLSVMEMSHRSKAYEEIIFGTVATFKSLLKVGDDYEVIFLGGGAHSQFLMTALNMIGTGKVGNYVVTGEWAQKAYKEAKKIGKGAHIAASSEDKNFSYLPKAFDISDNPAFLHYTSNNTIFGTEYRDDSIFPANIPLVCDMSSDILSRPLDTKKYALIYAGAQKNIGPAGATAVIIKKDLVDTFATDLPTMLTYKTHIEQQSMYNTPPTFPIYIIGLVLKWIEKQGLETVEKNNIAKAKLIYDVIDTSEFYTGTAAVEDRSLMNITFRLPNEELENKFISEAKKYQIDGIKGHRKVGGCRASTYNALPKKACETLANFMVDFEKANK
jgi:phosphoserine aminotransferase